MECFDWQILAAVGAMLLSFVVGFVTVRLGMRK